MDIIDKIYRLMEERKWSTYALSNESGVNQSTIANMFRKNQVPKIETLEKICKAFGLTLAEFFMDEHSKGDDMKLVASLNELSPTRKELTKAIINEFKGK